MPSNSLSYSNDIASNRWGHFCLLLLRIKGSIYRLIFYPLLIFLSGYAILSCIYRFALGPHLRQRFEGIVVYVSKFDDVKPMTFVLGFYTAAVLGRWWSTFQTIPWPYRVCVAANGCIAPNPSAKDKRKELLETRLLKRTIVRYASACCAMTLQQVTYFKNKLRREFPRLKNFQYLGLLTKDERHILENYDRFDLDIYEGLHTMCCRWKEGRANNGYCILWKVFNLCSWVARIIVCCCPFLPSCVTKKAVKEHKEKRWCTCRQDPDEERELKRLQEMPLTRGQLAPDFEFADHTEVKPSSSASKPKSAVHTQEPLLKVPEPQMSTPSLGTRAAAIPDTVLRLLKLKSGQKPSDAVIGSTLSVDIPHVDARQEELDIEDPTKYVPFCCCLPCVKVNVQCCDIGSKYCCAGKLMKCWQDKEGEHDEAYFLENFRSRKIGNYYVPLLWCMELVKNAYANGRIMKSEFYMHLLQEIQNLRSTAANLKCYMWINIPLAYTQVIEWVVIFYFSVMVVGRQFLDTGLYKKDPIKYADYSVDIVFPGFTVIEFVFYMGWLKIAEGLQNPFGDDECDFDLTSTIYTNYKNTLYMVDEAQVDFPDGLCESGYAASTHDVEILEEINLSTSRAKDTENVVRSSGTTTTSKPVLFGVGPDGDAKLPNTSQLEQTFATLSDAVPDSELLKLIRNTQPSSITPDPAMKNSLSAMDANVKRIERHMLTLEHMMAELLQVQRSGAPSYSSVST